MERPNPGSVKHREIGFRTPHPDPHQAQTAMLLLSDLEGVLQVSVAQPDADSLVVSYDVARIDLHTIETQLRRLGLHLDNSLLANLRRALYYYTEDNERQALAVHDDQEHATREVFMRCYRCRVHGCRDQRPEHWRTYL